MSALTFVVAVNNREVLQLNFLASPCVRDPHQILLQEHFSSASAAYNDAIERSRNDLIIFCHQDIYLPHGWLSDLARALDHLDTLDPNWGVLGCYGETLHDNGRGYIYSSGRGITGHSFDKPAPVQTLDEIVLILRKSSGLRFDPELPHFHLYGTDICLAAAARGMRSYAISAFCVHNTHQTLVLPSEFYAGCDHIRRVWKDYLPVRTTCVRLTRSGIPMYMRRLRETYLRYIRHKEVGGTRVPDLQMILQQLPHRPL